MKIKCNWLFLYRKVGCSAREYHVSMHLHCWVSMLMVTVQDSAVHKYLLLLYVFFSITMHFLKETENIWQLLWKINVYISSSAFLCIMKQYH